MKLRNEVHASYIHTYIIIFLYVTITNLLELHTSRIFVTCEMYYSLLLLCKMPMEATFLCMSYIDQ